MFDDATVDARIRYRWPFKGIYHDLDGTLTEQGADSYASAYFVHNEWPECTVDMDVYDGILCPSPLAIHRVVFHGANGNANGETMYVWQYPLDEITGMDETELEEYLVTENAS